MSETTCCKRWDDGGCDFGCQCDDCKPVPMTPEQVRAYYASLCPDDEDEVFRCEGCGVGRPLSALDGDGYCVTCNAFAIREKDTA